jgi:hypothetical protein
VQSLQIHQFNAQYIVARSLENPLDLKRRLDQVAMDLLTDALEISSAIVEAEPICFIEQMTVDLTADIAVMDDRQLAAAWAKSLQQGIARTLNQGGNGVTIFKNRGEFLASFLNDLLTGQAWHCWYYQEFLEWRSLPTSQAILTILTADSDNGRDALLILTQQGQLDRLLAQLSDTEVEAITRFCLLPASPNVVLPNTIPVWIQAVLSRLQQGFTLTGILARDVIRLYLELLHRHPELGPDVNLARFIRDLLQLRQTMMGRDDRHQLLQQLAADQWAGVLNQLERGAARQLLMTLMTELSGGEVSELLQDLQTAAPSSVEAVGMTSFGGIFLLLSAIVDLELHHFLQHCPYPEPEGISKTGLLLWAIVLQCLGYENAVQARSDRALTLLAGLAQPPTSSQLQHYAESLTPAMHATFAEQFQHHFHNQNHPAQFGFATVFSSPSPLTFDWFFLCTDPSPLLPNAEWDATLAIVSATVLRTFAARLGAFADSSPAYLCHNFLQSQATIELSSHQLIVRFITCPLQMILRMAGFDHHTWNVPWLENRQLTLQFD